MNRVLIDTNIYTAFKLGDEATVSAFRSFEFIGIDAVVIGELLSGFSFGKKESVNHKELQSFIDSPRVHFIAHDYSTAESYAVVYGQLRRKGKPIPSNDLWIAACALQHGLGLFTRDRHFDQIDGLRIVRRFP